MSASVWTTPPVSLCHTNKLQFQLWCGSMSPPEERSRGRDSPSLSWIPFFFFYLLQRQIISVCVCVCVCVLDVIWNELHTRARACCSVHQIINQHNKESSANWHKGKWQLCRWLKERHPWLIDCRYATRDEQLSWQIAEHKVKNKKTRGIKVVAGNSFFIPPIWHLRLSVRP